MQSNCPAVHKTGLAFPKSRVSKRIAFFVFKVNGFERILTCMTKGLVQIRNSTAVSFSEIVDLAELRGICEEFTALTGAVMAILDLDGNILIATGWQDICTQFHRVHPETSARCNESDTVLAGKLKKGEAYNVYQCKNGLVDVAVPITIEGVHVANFFTGQFFFSAPDKEYFLRQAEEMGFETSEYLDALSRVPVFSREYVQSLMSFFGRLVSLIGKMGSAEKAKEEERAHLRGLLDALPDLVWLKNPEGVYLTCNPRVEQYLGLPESQIVGKTDYDFFAKDMADSFRRNDQKAIEAGHPMANEELLTFASDGSQILVETTKVPVRNAGGALIGVLGIARDITERRRNEEKIAQQALRFKTLLDSTRDGVHILDADGNVIEASSSFCQMLGYSMDEILGMNVRNWEIDQPEPEIPTIFDRLMNGKGNPIFETKNRRSDASLFDVEISCFPLLLDGKTVLFCSSRDITERKRYQQQLEHIANHDILTNLPNRSLLEDRLRQAIAQSLRRGTSLAVVYLDLDSFKEVNDKYTHEIGDELLIALSHQLKACLREDDTLARMGGDEFVAVLTDLEHADDCKPVLERLQTAASNPLVLDNKILKVSASIGVTLFPQDGSDADLLLRHADQAMYQAKQEGKNRYRHFDTDNDIVVKTKRDNLERIRWALKMREFVLFYQPKVNMRTGEVIGVEALIRWQHPEQGLLHPAAFLPLIEDHQISVSLGEWVIDAALTQTGAWRQAGLNLPVSVNVGARQLQQNDFIHQLDTLLAAHPGVHPSLLELEILETSTLGDFGLIIDLIRNCQRMGIRFALDDFGTGYSALTYLKRFPAEILKIDQSFVRDMMEDQNDLAIVKGIIGLAEAFGRVVIAEGVETAAVGATLLSLGCELAQGYSIARPMPGDAIPQWVNTWRPHEQWTNPGVGRNS
jgi:diguanylate cyclase (GGDEF)-like protein/PAS domain S-box-containing protein